MVSRQRTKKGIEEEKKYKNKTKKKPTLVDTSETWSWMCKLRKLREYQVYVEFCSHLPGVWKLIFFVDVVWVFLFTQRKKFRICFLLHDNFKLSVSRLNEVYGSWRIVVTRWAHDTKGKGNYDGFCETRHRF